MDYRKITAIVRSDTLEHVEMRLKAIGIDGISVTKVKGFGEYSNFYSRDWLVTHARIEIFALHEQAESIAEVIIEAAHSGTAGDGLVAILPVERLYRIRTKSSPDFVVTRDE